MDEFSKLKPAEEVKQKKEKVHFSNDYIKIVDFEDWTVITGKDGVICIPYLIEQNKFIIRQEYIPSYKMATGQEFHLSCVGGGIEEGETPEEALLREVQEEAGLVIRESYKIDLESPLFLQKSSTIKLYSCILPLTSNDYTEVQIKGDGSRVEKISKTVAVDVKYINSLVVSDIQTQFMLEKFKRFINL
jgi:8-oxo-dGTP pyrophosphatase MutT (NUDIX family)